MTDSQTPNAAPTERVRHIIVGIDGSPQAAGALHWAAEHAARRSCHLELVMAYSVPLFGTSAADVGFMPGQDEILRDATERLLDDAVQQLDERRASGLPTVGADQVTTAVAVGDAAGVLLDRSTDAELIVVGARGRGGFIGRLLGSVSSAVPAHASCPTVVVPLSAAERTDVDRVVVVGVDGSASARYAALAAADEAAARHARLRMVWALPEQSGVGSFAFQRVDQHAAVAEMTALLRSGAEWLQGHLPGLDVEIAVVHGSPIEVLIRESDRAELLVTGTRGRGGFTGLLLGSTSQGILGRSHSPVLVVPAQQDERLADRVTFGPLPAD